MKDFYNNYLNDKIELEKYQIIGIICLVIVISGVFGWVYEFIFYFFNSGMKTFYYQGGNFLPWINIYAIGSILIMLFTNKYKKKPFVIFLLSVIITGVLEYVSGYLVLKYTGCRYWDYNTEILNFLNIDGFICLRSVCFFGLSALLLMYFILPFCIFFSCHVSKKTFLIISIGLCSLFLIDEIYNLVFTRLFGFPRASKLYKIIGFKYMDYKCGK